MVWSSGGLPRVRARRTRIFLRAREKIASASAAVQRRFRTMIGFSIRFIIHFLPLLLPAAPSNQSNYPTIQSLDILNDHHNSINQLNTAIHTHTHARGRAREARETLTRCRSAYPFERRRSSRSGSRSKPLPTSYCSRDASVRSASQR